MNLKELQNLLDKASSSYYTTGNSIMEDAKYDSLLEELRKLNPTDLRLTRIGSNVRNTILTKTKHTIMMGSQSKVTNEQEWKDWIQNNVIKNGISLNEKFFASYKMDGGSVSLQYKNGKLIEAISRGDGVIGENLTANALSFKGLPTSVKNNFTGFVRGEIVLNIDDWEKIDPEKNSNPRNLCVGIARRKSGEQSEYLTFYGFRILDNNGNPMVDTESEMNQQMKNCGFNVVESFVGSLDSVWKWYNKIENIRSTLNFWIDRIVAITNSVKLQSQLGESSGCPKSSVAIKFEAEGAESVLRGVTLQIGHTGAIVPVANFDPVRIGGTTVMNATLCNWDNIETLGVAIGDKISVIKAGDIIPRIMEVTEKGKNRQGIPLPTKCPVCSGKVGHRSNVSGEESAVIYCLNTECPSVITGKIDKYLSSLDIQGIGTNLIESLVNDLGVKDPSDLYILSNKRNQMADLILSGKVRLGEKRADKFLAEIEKRRIITLSEFLGSLGVFGLGKRRVTLIQEALVGKMDTLEDWFSNTLINNAAEAGVKNMAQGIHDELVRQKDYIMKFIKNGLVISQPQPKQELKSGACIICITGALSQPKAIFQKMIEAAGHGYADSFSKSVTHLVAADPNSGSAKLEKAKKNGTKVISEQELIKLVS